MSIFFNIYFATIGILFLIINKLRYALIGYRTPRPFATNLVDKCIKYDIRVVEGWTSELYKYTGGKFDIKNKNILEVGPGADLGVGLILLGKGAAQYNAVDVNPLATSLSMEFYEQFFDYIQANMLNIDVRLLRNQLNLFYEGKECRLKYYVEPDFTMASVKDEKIDIVLSQAAFEHFDDVERTVSKISKLVMPEGYFLAIIDLQTHTRYIREKDPLNIYRYSKAIYSPLKFRGLPNRIRPAQYTAILAKYGWKNIVFEPNRLASSGYIKCVKPYISKKFRDDDQLNVLSGSLIAQKG